jgi:hypothetical protein
MLVTGNRQQSVVPSARAERRRIHHDNGVFLYACVTVALCLLILAIVWFARFLEVRVQVFGAPH